MKKKFYILALTFLCLLIGQSSFGQTSGGDYNLGDVVADFCAQNPESCHEYGGNDLLNYLDNHSDAVLSGEFHDYLRDNPEFASSEDFQDFLDTHGIIERIETLSDADYDAWLVDHPGILCEQGHANSDAHHSNEHEVHWYEMESDSGDPCDPWSSAYDYYLCNGMGNNEGDSGDPCDPWSSAYNPSQCTGDSGDPCDPSSIAYDPSQCTGDSGDPCDPYSSAYDPSTCNGGTASTCRGCNPAPDPNPVIAKLTAVLKAAGITNIVINPITRPLLVARCLAAYTIIAASSDSSCNNTPGGCQSWLNSNYIGATSSKDKAEVQRGKGVEPIDAVDLAAYNHDVAYDHVNAAGAIGAIFDLNTLPADRDLLAACHHVLDMYDNREIDPKTGNPVSRETRERAILVIAAFEIVVTEKELRT